MLPSKANVADLPTRPCRASYAFLRALGARRIALVLPPFPAWDESPAFWMDRGVAVAEGAARAAELHEQVGAEGASRALPPSPAAAAPSSALGHITLANHRHCMPCEGDVAIDRTHEAPLANPWPIGSHGPHVVCEAFEALMRCGRDAPELAVRSVSRDFGLPAPYEERPAAAQQARIEALDALVGRVRRGMGVRLVCWCYPRRCHGEDIRRRVYELVADAERAAEAPSRRRKRARRQR